MKHPSTKPCYILKLCFTLVLALILKPTNGQHALYLQYLDHPWVDSVLATLSPEERITQSIWLTTGSERDLAHYINTSQLISDYGIGGLVFGQGTAGNQTQLLHYYQSISSVPLAVALEGEIGSESGLKEMRDYPGQMVLEAITSDSLLSLWGMSLAQQLSLLGTQLLLTPGIDINVDIALKEHHIWVSEKYYPEPGTGKMDSILNKLPGFQGVVAMDAAKTMELAFCFDPDSLDMPAVISRINTLVERKEIDTTIINHRARMILAFKYWSDLHLPFSARGSEVVSISASAIQKALIRDLYAHSLTVLNNRSQVIPVKELDRKRIASIAINHPSPTAFQDMAGNFTRIDKFHWHPGDPDEDSLLEQLGTYDLVLAGIYPADSEANASGQHLALETGAEGFISALAEKTELISVCFGDPGGLDSYENLQSSAGLMLTYERNRYTEELAAQLVFGGLGGQGRLPVTVNNRYPAGSGIRTPGNLRLQYAIPENAGISSRILNQKIDSIVKAGLDAGAFPGCEVIAARKGRVIFHKTYGYHTYDKRIEVRKQDLYDLASVTKVSGPTAGLMMLESMGKFSHSDRMVTYFPWLKGSDKANLWLKDVLAHRAGLYPWIPYWQETVKKNGHYKKRLVRNTLSEKYSLPVAQNLYLKSNFRKKIYRTIKKSELGEKTYLYSGLSFFIFPEMIERLSGERYEDFLSGKVYHKLGAWDVVFNPWRFYPLSRIVPTEYDSLFRKRQVHGYVHDEGAAMMGDYSGNAGLFATANDLLKLFEMYRRMGSYGGEQIIPEEILKNYTSYQFPERKNRRGLGFDKPLLDEHDGTPEDYPCPGASPSSFGHSGFTGTYAWVDPEYEITYVFLSNRVYPTRNNNLLSDMDIRTNILQSLYDSIIE